MPPGNTDPMQAVPSTNLSWTKMWPREPLHESESRRLAFTIPGCKSSYAPEGWQMEPERMNISLHFCLALLQSLLLPGIILGDHQNDSFREEGRSYLLFQRLVGISMAPLALVQQCC